MKIVVLAVALLGFIPSVYAEDNVNPLLRSAQCQAVDISLLQIHNMVAASITALSPNPPKELLLMREGYLSLAKEDQERVQAITKVTNDVILPGYKDAKSEAVQHFMAQLTGTINHIQEALGAIDYESQVKVQNALMARSRECESFFGQMAKHTPEPDTY